jgi:hypothetical protein
MEAMTLSSLVPSMASAAPGMAGLYQGEQEPPEHTRP